MRDDSFAPGTLKIRSTDTNSLFRLYDSARAISSSTASQTERTRAEKTIQRIADELHKRKLPLSQ